MPGEPDSPPRSATDVALRKSTGVARSRATERTIDAVVKYYDTDEKAEAAATKYRHLVALQNGLFASPVVRAVRRDPPRIEFELLDSECTVDVEIVRVLRSTDPIAAVELVASVGRALAHIHDGLDLPSSHRNSRSLALKAQLPPGGLEAFAPIPRVTLHGDFGMSNVAVDADGGLVIYDPEPSRYTSGAVDSIDVPEMDLATFVTCLAGRTRGLGNMWLMRQAYAELSDAFLSAYASSRSVEASDAFHRDRLAALMVAQGAAYRAVAGRGRGALVAALARWAAARLPETKPDL